MRIGFVAMCYIAATTEAVNLQRDLGKPHELVQAEAGNPLCSAINWLTSPTLTCNHSINPCTASSKLGLFGKKSDEPEKCTPAPVMTAAAPPAPKIVDKKGNPVPVVTDPITGAVKPLVDTSKENSAAIQAMKKITAANKAAKILKEAAAAPAAPVAASTAAPAAAPAAPAAAPAAKAPKAPKKK